MLETVVGEIEIDSPEMHVDQTRSRSKAAPLPDAQSVSHRGAIEERPITPSAPLVEPQVQYSLLLRASLGLRVVAACAAIIWLYILGGELIEFAVGGKEGAPTDKVYLSPFLQLAMTFIMGASAVCLLAGASEALRALLDIRNSLARSYRR